MEQTARAYTGLEFLTRLPPELERLTSLQSLDLSSCGDFSGDLSPLANLTSIQLLNLNGCYQLSSDLSPLANLTSLQLLDLSGCRQLSGDLSPLAGLTSLQSLHLSWCEKLSGDLTPLADLTSLQTLNLSSCEQLSDLSPLAGLTSLQWLDLGGCRQISNVSPLANLTLLRQLGLSVCDRVSDISPLTKLTELQYLNLSGCEQLSDLAPLVNLTALQRLDISCCHRLSNLSPLATLTGLQQLNLHYCKGVRQFCHLKPLLPRLQVLNLARCPFNDLPAEVCGEHDWQNVVDKVRAHYEDLKSGQQNDAEVKVFLLGNGGVGKTQLCRRLRGLKFDDKNVSSTHGIQLSDITLSLEGFSEPVRLNFWDFGGQEIYHVSHALFLHGQAIVLVLWTPELEQGETYQESGLTLRHRPLSYWLDYLRAYAGTDASVLIVQSQCDTRPQRMLHPPALVDDFPFHRFTEVSARTGLNLGILKESIKEAVRDRFERRPPPPIGVSRVAVRNRLRQMLDEDQKREPSQRQHRLLERAEFDRMCDEVGGVSDSTAVLDFLHHNGVVFYRSGLFDDRIILDQNWALVAIYAIFDRKRILPLLRGYGRFSRADLETLIWSGYTPEEQKVFLGIMESCGICFRVRELPNAEPEYIAPELLPEWSDAQEQLLGRLRDDPPDAKATARYVFLHEGILRGYLSRLGEHAKDAAIYWKYGCWFFEQKSRSQVLIKSLWNDSQSESGSGTIRLQAWGELADHLVYKLLKTLESLPVGQPPEISLRIANLYVGKAWVNFEMVQAGFRDEAEDDDYLQISSRPELPPKKISEIFVSYAWGDHSSEEARQRVEVVDRFCETLRRDGWHIHRDSNVLRSGELISGFMKRIGLADHVIVVLSDKYLRSPYCMTELHYIYQNSRLEKQEFLGRIIPLVLDDARFGTPEERVEYAKHWEARYLKLKSDLDHLSVEDFRLYKSMQKWRLDIGEMLTYVNDVLTPHGFEEIVKEDFAALRQMLTRQR